MAARSDPFPIILPFRRPEPAPLLEYCKTFVADGRMLQVQYARWRERDLDLIPHACRPLPGHPGLHFSMELLDVEAGCFSRRASDDEVSRALARPGLGTPRSSA